RLWPRVLAPTARLQVVLVATFGGRLLGFAWAYSDRKEPGVDDLAALYVAKEARKSGVGAMLMRELADRLTSIGRTHLRCWAMKNNVRARAFYARLGAVESMIEESPLLPGAADGGTLLVEDVRLDFPSLPALGRAARAEHVRRLASLGRAGRVEQVRGLALPLSMPALDVAEVTGAPHPAGESGPASRRRKRRLALPFGLTQFGVNLLTLAPGVHSAPAHVHSHEDEFVYVLDGEVWLVSGEEARRLGQGEVAGFPAGGPVHHLENRGASTAWVLEIGSRLPDRDTVQYPGRDLEVAQAQNGRRLFVRKDGTVLGPAD
ncbi:MAG: GNAT family N-acetyltransferase, partial [Pseudomonadota bacterium]